MRARWWLVAVLGAASCAPASDAGLDRARATIGQLAGTIGSRPVGSEAANRARSYVETNLRDAGFVVRIQMATAVNAALGASARVTNVIAVKDAGDRDAIALISHYDSVPDGPGAQDDALGVATCLEAARQLSTTGLRHSLMVIVTDGEEIGLMGARAARLDPEVSGRVRTFLNFDGTGGTGPPVLFEAGPGRSAALDAWAHHATAPFGGSFGLEIYKRLPNDTDFTIFKNLGASGLNFAPVGDSYVYHTDRDRPSGVSDATISREISNTVSTVRALDASTLGQVDDTPTFFDVAQRVGIVYSATMTKVLGISAAILGLIAWVLIGRAVLARRGFWVLVGALVRGILTSAAAGGAMVAAAGLLRTLRHQAAPWYASPQWAFTAFAAVGAGTVWLAGRVRVRSSGAGKGPSPRPLLVWWMSLPVWIALTVALLMTAPAASYLTGLPLGLVAALMLVSRRLAWLRLASLLAFGVVAVLWTSNIVVLLGFLVPLFGWLPVMTPVWLYPAVIGLFGLMLLPPWIAIWTDSAAGRSLIPTVGTICLAAAVVFGVGACVVPTYTDDRPARRTLRYVQDDVRHEAWWDVGGSDTFTMGGGGAGTWTETHAPIAASAVVPALVSPIVFRSTTSPAASSLPAEVHAATSFEADRRLTLDITVTRQVVVTVRIVLPPGVAPVASSLPGAVSRDRWVASALALPPGTDDMRMTFDGIQPAALQGTVVLIMVPGVPAGSQNGAMPSWLPGGPATWQQRSVFILPAGPEGS